jgi:hypothetical protein
MKKTKTHKKNLIILMTFVTLLCACFFPLKVNANFGDLQTSVITPKSSQIIQRTVRVAIYNEPNVTRPGYAALGNMHNNYTALKNLLISAGYPVSELTTNDITNHELITADYDVFILADNVPRENITDYVKEFWLGGGGIMSFDSAISYICYAGMIPPESEGSESYLLYWAYSPFSTVQNITTRHPITRAYQVNDTITEESIDWAAFDWTALQGTSIASEITKLATKVENSNLATVVAFDPDEKGGRVVQMLGEGESIGVNMDDLIIDAIDWLCPRPKGRVVFDLSHHPRLAVDDWDDLSAFPGYFEDWRNELVSRRYTFDKLYPSASGNFTLTNLNKYDLLVVVSPDTSISTSEATAVSNWINTGGSLLALGDNPTGGNFDLTDQEINKLLASYDLALNLTFGIGGTINISPVSHPTIEACSNIEMGSRGAINVTGQAHSLWELGSYIHIAYQDTGNGRIILSGDMNWLTDTSIGNQDNRQFANNMVNWLTSDDAEVLLFVDEPDSPNYYRTPVSNALNELGINFYLTFDDAYTNLSLNLNDWELLIIDNPWVPGFSTAMLGEINNYVAGGGRLIMSTFRVNYDPTHPLWTRLGFTYNQAQPGSSSLYIWDITHPIFNHPVDYGVSRFDPFKDYGDEGDLLTVYPNATALGGYTVTETADNANVVLGNGGKTLFNGYLIDQFTGDFDNSAYSDNLELWINEISFMWAQIIAEPIIDGGIPGYDLYLVLFTVVSSIGVISIITLRKRRKN